jgi:hypothetical protein
MSDALMGDASVTRAGELAGEYLDHRRRVSPAQRLWENNGWSVRGTGGDRELLLWTSPYLLQSGPDGPFVAERLAVSQTVLVLAEPGQDGGPLVDAPFVSAGWDPADRLPWHDVVVEERAGSVRWSAAGRIVEAAPPRFTLGGDHAGIGLAVDIEASAAPLWLSDPAQPLGEREDRWFVVNGLATGTVAVGGERLSLRGHAVHERHVHLGTGYDPVRLLAGEGVTWHTAHGESLTLAVLSRPTLGTCWGQAIVEGEVVDLSSPGAIAVEVTDRWIDPRTGFVVPSAWVIELRRGAGSDRLVVELRAQRRAYYLWNHLIGGETVCYWWLATGRASLLRGGGTRRDLGPLRAEAHRNRTFYVAPPTGTVRSSILSRTPTTESERST